MNESNTTPARKYHICQKIAKLSAPNNGYTKELTLVSWNNREPVYDIRAWNVDYSHHGPGVTLTKNQLAELKKVLDAADIGDIFGEKIKVARKRGDSHE